MASDAAWRGEAQACDEKVMVSRAGLPSARSGQASRPARQRRVNATVGNVVLNSGGPGWTRTSEGVEPPDLQSGAFDHFATDPRMKKENAVEE